MPQPLIVLPSPLASVMLVIRVCRCVRCVVMPVTLPLSAAGSVGRLRACESTGTCVYVVVTLYRCLRM